MKYSRRRIEEQMFSCNHPGDVPKNMGRGKARAERLEKYFSRPCLACARKDIEEYVDRLTHVNGTPLHDIEKAHKIAKMKIDILRTY